MFDAKALYGSVAASAVALLLSTAPGYAQAPATPPPPMPQVLASYRPVTADMLKSPNANDWLMVRRTYDGQAYSPLTQITTKNVGRLAPVWIASTGVANGHQAAPIVNNGVMFVATPGNQV